MSNWHLTYKLLLLLGRVALIASNNKYLQIVYKDAGEIPLMMTMS